MRRRAHRLPALRAVAAALAAALALAGSGGCHSRRDEPPAPPSPPPAAALPGEGGAPSGAAPPATGPIEAAPPVPADNAAGFPAPPASADNAADLPAPPAPADRPADSPGGFGAPMAPPPATAEEGTGSIAGPETAKPAQDARETSPPLASTPAEKTPPPDRPPEVRVAASQAPLAETAPEWVRSKEDLSYKVSLLGITMGYARFTFAGQVRVEGREAYHIKVRAWTAGILSALYPVNETADYYLDAETLAPLRQDLTGRKKKRDEIVIYDQEKGAILWWYRDNRTLRRRIEAAPDVYDPVSVAFFYRTRGMADESLSRNLYAGRKMYRIALRSAGSEKLTWNGKEIETDVVRPVLRLEGKPVSRGDMAMWVTRDSRRVPIRLYAKFRKIRVWTLVGELFPPRGEERRVPESPPADSARAR